MELLPERDCATCTQIKKVEWGCTEDATQQLSIGGVEQTRCPRRPVLDDPVYFGELFWLYRRMQDGILQEAGGLQDQASRLVDSLRIIESTVNECTAIKQQKDEDKRARMDRIHGKGR